MKLQEPPIPIERIDALNGRYYRPLEEWWKESGYEGERPAFGSVTTVENVYDKGVGFQMWLGNSNSYADAMEYAQMRAKIGTIVHEIIQRYIVIWLENKELKKSLPQKEYEKQKGFIDLSNGWWDREKEEIFPITDEIIKYLMSFIAFWRDYTPEPEALELSLMNIEQQDDQFLYPFAGTLDFKGAVTKRTSKTEKSFRAIIDWKTGKEYPVHVIQTNAYKILDDSFCSMLNLDSVDAIGALYLSAEWKKEPTYKMRWHPIEPTLWYDAVKANKTMYYLNNCLKRTTVEYGSLEPMRLPREFSKIITPED